MKFWTTTQALTIDLFTHRGKMIKKSPDYISVIDVSNWEHDAYYERIHLDFIPDGIIAKASEYKWKDASAKKHMAGAALVGARRGLYHFYRPHDLQAQIATFLAVSEEAGALVGGRWVFEIPPILDVEYTPPPKDKNAPRGNALAYEVKFLLDAFEKVAGRKPVIYTGKYYWTNLNNALGQPPSWCKDYPLWVSAYPDDPDKHSKPYLQVGGWGDSWAMWQYSEAGVMKNAFPYDGVDLNIANPEWWNTLPLPNGGTTPTPEPTPAPAPTVQRKVKRIIFDDGSEQIV